MARKPDIHELIGLISRQASRIQGEEGPNELPSSKQLGNLRIALDVMLEPMFMLLAACGAIYLMVGDMQEALIVLAEGDRVPADALVMDCTSLSTDESLLTGECLAVRKVPGNASSPSMPQGGDDIPFVFSGTMVVRGQGIARVVATGQQSTIGKIGKALQTVTGEETRLQRETRHLVRILATAVLGLCALLIVVYGITRGAWLDGVLAGLTLAMAIMPNELPVVLTIFLAIGAWRLSRTQVLARSAPVVETLGSATVLCVDKTGTLALNRRTVAALHSAGIRCDIGDFRKYPPPDTFHDLAEFSFLACQCDPFDPMEQAIKEFGKEYLAHTEHLHGDWRLEKEYPLTPELLAMAHVWSSPEGLDYVIAAKGAPEAVADLCHFSEGRFELDTMSEEELQQRIQTVNIFARVVPEQKLRLLNTALTPSLPAG